MTTEPGDIHIRRKDMLKRVGLAYSTIKLMISAGQFPEPVILTPNSKHPRLAWVLRELDEWQASLPRRSMRSPSSNGRAPVIVAAAEADRLPSAPKTIDGAQPPVRPQTGSTASRPRLKPAHERQPR